MHIAESQSEPLLQVQALTVNFETRQGQIQAVREASFAAVAGRITGLVGESGSGKTTLSRVVTGLQRATSGSIRFRGTELTTLDRRGWQPFRKQIQMVFQDPYRALNPSLSVAELIAEPLRIHFPEQARKQRRERIEQLLQLVGLPDIDAGRRPAHFSGGQRQRIGIARALAVEPSLLILDEPVSALDVSVQAQILNLLQDLQGELGLTCLFIAHDLAVVEHLCDDVVVMRQGEVVETASAEQLYRTPRHPYTQRLLAAAPRL